MEDGRVELSLSNEFWAALIGALVGGGLTIVGQWLHFLWSTKDKKNLDEAQRQSMRPIFGACGFNRNTPLDILYGPHHLAGAGFIPWEVLQGEGHITTFLQHWRTTTKIGKMLKVSWAWAQFFSGIGTLASTRHRKSTMRAFSLSFVSPCQLDMPFPVC